MRSHAPDLTVFALPQNHFDPGRRNRLAKTDRRSSRPQAPGFVDQPHLAWLGDEVGQGNSLCQGMKCGVGRLAFNLRKIALGKLVAGIGDPGLEGSVIRKQQKAFRIRIQPPGRIHARNGNEIREGFPTLYRRELGQDAKWLVEQQQPAQFDVSLA